MFLPLFCLSVSRIIRNLSTKFDRIFGGKVSKSHSVVKVQPPPLLHKTTLTTGLTSSKPLDINADADTYCYLGSSLAEY